MVQEIFFEYEKKLVPILIKGAVGILPTDTLYGMVGSALNKKTVERIYAIRKRDTDKPLIVLISAIKDLEKFGIKINAAKQKKIKEIWPGKVSIVFPCLQKKYAYIHRGSNTIAFRFPSDKNLQRLLKKTGPLVAPSANPSGGKPAATYIEAEKYFKNKVDFYVDAGKLSSKPSTLIEIGNKGDVSVLRQGAVKFDLKTGSKIG